MDMSELERLREENAALAAVIEQAYTAAMMQSGKEAARILATADTDAALAEVRAKAIEDFYEALELPGTDATGYYSGNDQAGYAEAERHLDTRLHAYAAAIREGRA